MSESKDKSYYEKLTRGIDQIISQINSDDPLVVIEVVEQLSSLICKDYQEGITYFTSRMKLWEKYVNTTFVPNSMNYICSLEKFLFLVSLRDDPLSAMEWKEFFIMNSEPMGLLMTIGQGLLTDTSLDVKSVVDNLISNIDSPLLSEECREDLTRLLESKKRKSSGLKTSRNPIKPAKLRPVASSVITTEADLKTTTDTSGQLRFEHIMPSSSLRRPDNISVDSECHNQTIFPFLNTQIPPERYCSVIRKSELFKCLSVECVGSDIEKVNNLNYKDAWELCDNIYFIPMMDKRRAHYHHKAGKKSHITEEIVETLMELGISGGKREFDEDAVIKLFRKQQETLEEILVNLRSKGMTDIPRPAQPVYIPPPSSLPLSRQDSGSTGTFTMSFSLDD